MHDVTHIVFGMYLVDFYERKYGIIVPSSFVELERLREVYPDEIEVSDYIVGNKHLKYRLKERFPLVHDILTFGKGKISLCGISILDNIYSTEESFCDFDLYIHSCTLTEANVFIEYCISLSTINIMLERDYFKLKSCDSEGEEYNIRIFLTIFKDRDSILRNIGPIPERHGYDPIAKYFSTFSASLSLAIKVAPIDINPNVIKLNLYSSFGILSIFHGKTTNNFDDPKSHTDVGIYDCRRCHLYTMPVVNDNIEKCSSNVISTRLFEDVKVLPMNIRDYFGKDYVPVVIGISNDRYVAFNGIKELFNIHDDIFRMLCDYWLTVEVFDTKTKLMNRSFDE